MLTDEFFGELRRRYGLAWSWPCGNTWRQRSVLGDWVKKNVDDRLEVEITELKTII